MCGRVSVIDIDGVEETIYAFTKKFVPEDWTRPRYNVAPTQQVLVLREIGGERELTTLHWWLIPYWSKEPTSKYPTFNARGETAHELASFRTPFKKRRCLILVSGFYEWPKIPKSAKVKPAPSYIHLPDQATFAIAGLWDRWTDPKTGVVVESCSMITTEANPVLAAVPHDRMPVILRPDQYDAWLDEDLQDVETVRAMIHQYPAGAMNRHLVDPQYVNYRIDDPRCIEPFAD